MSDQDNLRERIERQLCMFFDENYDGHLFDASQAIIDEFGLTNEWSFRFEGKDRRYSLNRAEDLRTIGLYGPLEDAAIESRVVGEWEKHD